MALDRSPEAEARRAQRHNATLGRAARALAALSPAGIEGALAEAGIATATLRRLAVRAESRTGGGR